MQVMMEQTKKTVSNQVPSEITYGNIASKQRNVSKSYHRMDIFHYSSDSDSNLLGVKPFQDQGMTMEEMKSLASVIDLDTYQDKMVLMSNCVSEKDLGKMYEEGFAASTSDVEEYVDIVDLIKLTEAKCGKIIAGYNDNLSEGAIEAATGNVALAKVIKNTLDKAGLPDTKELVKKIEHAVEMGKELGTLDDASKKYLVENNLNPTIKNLFEAKFSGSQSEYDGGIKYESSREGYVFEYGKAQEESVSEEEVKTLLRKNGLPEEENTIKNARWLMKEQIPISQKSMKLLGTINDCQLPKEEKALVEAIVQNLKDGKMPADTGMEPYESCYEQAVDYEKRFEGITENAVFMVTSKNLPLTLTSLEYCETYYVSNKENPEGVSEAQENLIDIESEDGTGRESASFLSAKRVLEEVRLHMSARANLSLLKAGISIDTTELSKLVDALKFSEKKIAEKLFGEEENAITWNKNLEQTTEKLTQMTSMPIYMVGISMKRETLTLNAYYEEGSQLQKRLDQAKESYETYMTVARADLGDNMESAFSNVRELLTEAGIEASKENVRGAKILGYNHIEITEENLSIIKEADSKLNYVLQELNPKMILDMIRNGEDPMSMEVDSLLEKIDEYGESKETEHMRFSKFLYGLDQRKEISPEERSQFIEVYHILKQVEKKNGAPIGACLLAGAELTLGNLKKAYQASHKSMDYTLENGDMTVSRYRRDVKSISHSLQADTLLKGMENGKEVMDLTIENLKELLEREGEETRFFESEQEMLSNAGLVDEKTAKELAFLELPVSVQNLLAYQSIKEQRGEVFRTYEKTMEGKKEEPLQKEDLSATFLEEIEDFKENLSSESVLEEKYGEMLTKMEDSIMETIQNADGYIDLKQMMNLGKQVGILKAMEQKKEYEIPMLVKDQLTSVHVRFDQESTQKGNVVITTQLPDSGKVGANLTESNGEISGWIVTDTKDEKERLEEIVTSMKEKLTEANLSVRKIEVVITKELNLDALDQVGVNKEKSTATNAQLYQVAKAFLTSI